MAALNVWTDVASNGTALYSNISAGTVNVAVEGATSAEIGHLSSTGAFVAYDEGAVGGTSSTVVACGEGTALAVKLVGTGKVRVSSVGD